MRSQLTRQEWTAADLARRTGISPSRISDWLAGKRRPSSESCLRLADAFNADPDYVLALAGHREPTEPLAPDDPRSHIIALVKRVRMTPTQAAALEAMLTAWLELERSGQLNDTPNGT
jgi:transcriptional regulator with XRE-family HTH domain